MSLSSPYSNVNFRREYFGIGGRCLDSNLNKAVSYSYSGPSYPVNPADYVNTQPGCYLIQCNPPLLQTYQVYFNDSGKIFLAGTCYKPGDVLKYPGYSGGITCASPTELCTDLRPRHALFGTNITVNDFQDPLLGSSGVFVAGSVAIAGISVQRICTGSWEQKLKCELAANLDAACGSHVWAAISIVSAVVALFL